MVRVTKRKVTSTTRVISGNKIYTKTTYDSGPAKVTSAPVPSASSSSKSSSSGGGSGSSSQPTEEQQKQQILAQDQQLQSQKTTLSALKPGTFAYTETQRAIQKREAELVGGSYSTGAVVINKDDKAFKEESFEATKTRQQQELGAPIRTTNAAGQPVSRAALYQDIPGLRASQSSQMSLLQQNQLRYKAEEQRAAFLKDNKIVGVYDPVASVSRPSTKKDSRDFIIGGGQSTYIAQSTKPAPSTGIPKGLYREAPAPKSGYEKTMAFLDRQLIKGQREETSSGFKVRSTVSATGKFLVQFPKYGTEGLDPQSAAIAAGAGAFLTILPAGKIKTGLTIAGVAAGTIYAGQVVRNIQTKEKVDPYNIYPGSGGAGFAKEVGAVASVTAGGLVGARVGTAVSAPFRTINPALAEIKTGRGVEYSYVKEPKLTRLEVAGSTGKTQQVYASAEQVPTKNLFIIEGTNIYGKPIVEIGTTTAQGQKSAIFTKNLIGRPVAISRSIDATGTQKLTFINKKGVPLKTITSQTAGISASSSSLARQSRTVEQGLIKDNLATETTKFRYDYVNTRIQGNKQITGVQSILGKTQQTAMTSDRLVQTVTREAVLDERGLGFDTKTSISRQTTRPMFVDKKLKVPKGDTLEASAGRVSATIEPRLLSASDTRVSSVNKFTIETLRQGQKGQIVKVSKPSSTMKGFYESYKRTTTTQTGAARQATETTQKTQQVVKVGRTVPNVKSIAGTRYIITGASSVSLAPTITSVVAATGVSAASGSRSSTRSTTRILQEPTVSLVPATKSLPVSKTINDVSSITRTVPVSKIEQSIRSIPVQRQSTDIVQTSKTSAFGFPTPLPPIGTPFQPPPPPVAPPLPSFGAPPGGSIGGFGRGFTRITTKRGYKPTVYSSLTGYKGSKGFLKGTGLSLRPI